MPAIYRMEIPIPKSPLKATNAYVIKGKDRNLLVDTGTNTGQSLAVIREGLAELDVDIQKTDIFTTHMHADHSGLLPSLRTETSRLYATAADSEVINSFLTADNPLEWLRSAACRNGFTPGEAAAAIQRHPANAPRSREALPFVLVAEGTGLTVGDYSFVCLETPGHTDGHVCLYEPNHKILLSGDHILGDISPNITCWGEGNPLEEFIASLHKIGNLAVDLVLPGHRRIFTDCRGRIEELLAHHKQRAEEALTIVGGEPKTGYQVAAGMTWDMVYKSWEEVAPAQKFFATGEAISHLRYLECQGLIQSAVQEGTTVYWR